MKRLTVAEHLAFGEQLCAAHAALSDIGARHGKTSRIAQRARRCRLALDDLCAILYGDVRAITRGDDPRDLANAVYFDGLVRDDTQNTAGDAFAGWSKTAAALPPPPYR